MEERLARQTVQIEDLSQSRIHQAAQLAEARQKVLSSRTRDREEMERLEEELRTARTDIRQVREKEKEVITNQDDSIIVFISHFPFVVGYVQNYCAQTLDERGRQGRPKLQ